MGSSRRGGWELWTVLAAVALGLVCAVGIVSLGFLGERNSVLLAKRAGGDVSLVRARQAWATAGAKSRIGGTGLLGRLISLATNETENMTASNSTMNDTDSTMNETISTESLPCTSWRGCPHMVVQALPEDIRFECGGEAAGKTCYGAMKACVESAEQSLRNMYIVSPILATESRKTSVCKCFVSNGCKPACNVAMYQRWSVGSGMNCPKDPPHYHRATGVYQYGDTNSDYVPASDLSFDYFPEYPNPGGHQYNEESVSTAYDRDPGAKYYQKPLYAKYNRGYAYPPGRRGRFNPLASIYKVQTESGAESR